MTTVEELFIAAGVVDIGVVPWGSDVPLDSPGVYVVSLNADANATTGAADCSVDDGYVRMLIAERPEATIDRMPATVQTMTDRLRQLWVPGEPAIYIGLAGGSVRDRIGQFYSTRIGARAPHAGGWPIKMIDQRVSPLWVHFGATSDPDGAERTMVARFVAGVRQEAAAMLVDPSAPLPFANLSFPQGRRKAHGMTGVKAARRPRSSPAVSVGSTDAPEVSAEPKRDRTPRSRNTQRITVADVNAGQVRIPARSKDIFPATTNRIVVRVDGVVYNVAWNPRIGADRERSGTIRLGKRLMLDRFPPSGPREVLEVDGEYQIV